MARTPCSGREMMAAKERADQMLVDLGLAESREKAKRLIMAGEVFLVRASHRERVAKPGQQISPGAELSVKEQERFVSRGGYKLLTAIESFSLDFRDMCVLDAGASTGGFTDCALQHGARRVYAVDVGRGQLHERLVRDERVANLERVNLRHAPDDLLPEQVDMIVADLSFISLRTILRACDRFLKSGGQIVGLIKPQFELGPGRTVKGVVKDEAARQEAVELVCSFMEQDLSYDVLGVAPSSILGAKGNQEFLLHARKA